MYSVSESYKKALLEKYITDTVEGTVQLKDGTVIELNDKNIVYGSLKIVHELCNDYRVGGFNLGSMKIGFFADNALLYDFSGAKITLAYKIKTADGTEEIPLGIYIADGQSVKRRRSTITLTAYDYGILFDCTIGASIRSMSGTAEEIITAVCSRCKVDFGGIAEGLPNTSVVLAPSSLQLQSCRDLVGWCADLLGGYAVIDRQGKLKIISARYRVSADDPTEIIVDKIITAEERNDIYSTDTRAWISRMGAYSAGKQKIYKSGITIDDEQAAATVYYADKNPLLDGKTETECDEINCAWLSFMDSFMQRGITAELYGDPAVDVGDIIRCSGGEIDQRRSVVGLVTKQEWCYRGFHSIICASAPISDGFSESEDEETDETAEIMNDSDAVYPVKVSKQSDKRISDINAGGVGLFVSNGINEENNAERFNDYDEELILKGGGLYSHAEGNWTYAPGHSAHAEGSETIASGDSAHAEGNETEAAGSCAHAEGRETIVTAPYGHAEGKYSEVSGEAAHAEGENSKAKGNHSHAEGIRSEAAGSCAHAEGYESVASGPYSHAGGRGTIAAGFYQTAIGKYNLEDENSLFIIGNGESDAERKNAFKVDKEGNVRVYGNLTVDGTGGGGNSEYTAGDGVVISADKVISLNAGNGLGFDSGGRLCVKQSEEEEGTASSFTAGAGINITEGEESSEISVDIDGDTITLDDNGKLKAKGLTLENAVVITEKDAAYLLHEYTEVEYIAGDRVVYTGPNNPIIIQGITCYKNGSTAPNGVEIEALSSKTPANFPDIPVYGSMLFGEMGILDVANDSRYVAGFHVELTKTSTNYNEYRLAWKVTYVDSVVSTSTYGYTQNVYDNDCGVTFVWNSIHAPGTYEGDTLSKYFPYGYAVGRMFVKRKSSSSSNYYTSTIATNDCALPFASEAEYNAAVGLTYTSNTLTAVQERVTEV